MSKEKRNQRSWIAPTAAGRAAYCICVSTPLLSPGLRRRVAQRPQRVLSSTVHFTACKAIISTTPHLLPPSTLAAGIAESAHLHMESGSFNRDVIDLPPFVRGKCSQTSQANFCSAAQRGTRRGFGLREGEKRKHQQRRTPVTAHTGTHSQSRSTVEYLIGYKREGK